MISDEVFVFKINYTSFQTLPDTSERLYLLATYEEIVDSWGPGYFITEIDAPYEMALYSL
jgi:hypothetical protein